MKMMLTFLLNNKNKKTNVLFVIEFIRLSLKIRDKTTKVK